MSLSIIAKNLTGSPLPCSSLGVPGGVIPASGQVTLTDHIPTTEIFDDDLVGYIQADSCVLVIDGVQLSKEASLNVFRFVNTGLASTFADSLVMIIFQIMQSSTSLTLTELQDGLLDAVYTSSGSLPGTAPSTLPAFAIVETGTAFPDIFWWQDGGTEWQQSTYTDNFRKPPDPNGDWIVDQAATGNGNTAWAYSMGTEFQITASGNGKNINAVGFYNASGGASHSWALLKSTAVQASAPALNTYTTVVDSGTFTSVAGWKTVAITDVPVATNEWYVIVYWVGTGGNSASIGTLRTAGQLNETFATVYAGTYASVPGSAPGSTPAPTNRQTGTLYGITSVRIK